MSADKSVIASDKASIVESLAVGKNSQFHVIISILLSLFIFGKSQLSEMTTFSI